jgi:outer membrane lipoprotein SlyB
MRFWSLALLMIVLAAGGCGYSNGSSSGGYQWKSLYRQDVQTVAVPIFKNVDFHRGVEIALTKAIVNNLESHTPYKVVDQKKADTVLQGEIVSIRAHTISSESRSAVPQEQLYVITCNFLWKDLRTGRILVDRKNFEQTTTYYPTLGESQWVGSQSGVEALAQGIVEQLQADW